MDKIIATEEQFLNYNNNKNDMIVIIVNIWYGNL